jgi:hypothetical protein
MNEKLCLIDEVVGATELCPEEACPFWETGGVTLPPGCGIERLGLGGELRRAPELADWLRSLRAQLDRAATPADRHAAYNRLFRQLLPPGLHD